MKKILSRLLIVIMLLVPVTGIAVFSTGCTLGSQQSAVLVEYKTLSSVVNVVELARSIYDDLYKQGRVSQALDDKVLIAYTEYQRVGNLAIKTAKAQAAAPLVEGADNTNVYIAELQNLVNGLIDLLNSAPTSPQTQHITIKKNAKP